MRRGLAAALLLAGCAAPPAPERPAPPLAEGPPAGFAGRVLAIDPARSVLIAGVRREGTLAALGHDHLLRCRCLSGRIYRGDDGTASARLAIEVGAFEVDPPDLLAARPDWAAHAARGEAAAATRENLLGPALLDAARHPRITLQVALVEATGPQARLEVDARVKGRAQRFTTAVDIERLEDDGEGLVLRLRGTVRHGELGLTPFSVMGGALRVADPIEVEIELVSRAVPR
ncbi:MAG: hypothetical protein KatS3mg121_1182 [Gammaproteobacteria bacterium]|nr:MAG: hypothetical protein KatS3mg121_1182 [Gammaproteobacteria bacterium]